MISSSELIQRKNNYIQLQNDLEGLSSSMKNSMDSLTFAVKGINNSYLIDGEPADYNKISDVNRRNNELYNELGKCKNAISAKIRELESQIKSALSYEAEQRRLREEELARQREEANNG